MSESLSNYIINFAAQDILKFQCLGGEVKYQNGALLICAPSMDQALNFDDTVIDKYSETSLAVSLQQWDQLMEQHNGSNKFQKLVYPFSANPNILITPIPSQQSHVLPRIVFIGTIEAVENACKFFHNNLPNEILVDR